MTVVIDFDLLVSRLDMADHTDSERLAEFMALVIYPWFNNFCQTHNTIADITAFASTDPRLKRWFDALILMEKRRGNDIESRADVITEYQFLLAQSLCRSMHFPMVLQKESGPLNMRLVVFMLMDSQYWPMLAQHRLPPRNVFNTLRQKLLQHNAHAVARVIVSLMPEVTILPLIESLINF